MRLLILRPQPGADASAKRVREAGFEPLVMPLFAIEPVEWTAPEPSAYDALLMTSGNAVRMAAVQVRDLAALPIYAVGAATADALTKVGVTAAATGTSGITDILGRAEADGHRSLLWLAGEDRTHTRPPEGMKLHVRTVYRSAAITAPAGLAESITATDAVLFHSARAARHFAHLCESLGIDRAHIVIAVLSAKIAEAAGTGWHAVVTTGQPNDTSLLSALQSHFTTTQRPLTNLGD